MCPERHPCRGETTRTPGLRRAAPPEPASAAEPSTLVAPAGGGSAPAMRPMLRPRDTALRIGVQQKTLANWRCKGRGPSFVRLGGPPGRGAVRYEAEAVEAWLAAHRREV